MTTSPNLPIEIWELIFEYLPVNDILAISSTCKFLRTIAFSLVLEKRVLAHLNTTDAAFLDQLIQSHAQYKKWVFMDVRLSVTGPFGKFWDSICHSLCSLTLSNVRLDNVFVQLLSKCPKLEELCLIAGNEMFIPWYINDDGTEETFPLSNLKHLSINAKSFINDSIFNKITSTINHLESLALVGCPVSNRESHENQQNWGLVDAHRLSFHFESIVNLIERNRKSLKRIDLTKTRIRSDKLLQLFGIPGLEVQQVVLNRFSSLDRELISHLLRKESPLRSLDLSSCENLVDNTFETFEHELSLQELDISYTPGLVQAKFITKLPNLKKLSMGQSVATPHTNLMRSFLSSHYAHLTYLDCSFNQIDEGALRRLGSVAPNLTHLNLAGCVNVDDEALLNICKELTKLKELNLKECHKITDYGFTGIPTKSTNEEAIHDDNELAETKETLAGLRTLTELEVLYLNSVPITDETLTVGFTCEYLRKLDLSNCHKLGPIAIGKVLVKCRRIEVLNLKDCYRITDSTVLLVSQFLRRVRRLHLDYCNKLTDDSVDSLFNSVYLRSLTLNKCHLIHDFQLKKLLHRNPYMKCLVAPSGADVLNPVNSPSPKKNNFPNSLRKLVNTLTV